MEHIVRYLARLPLLMRVGLLIAVTGAILDIIAHVAPHSHAPGQMLTMLQEGHLAHLVTLVGMVIVLAGLLSVSRSSRPRALSSRNERDEGKSVEAM